MMHLGARRDLHSVVLRMFNALLAAICLSDVFHSHQVPAPSPPMAEVVKLRRSLM